MRDMENAMAVAAQRAADDKQSARHGVVDAYDPNSFSVKVRLQPSNVLTGWIPIQSCYVGNGWGLFAAPTIGDAVQVDCQEGELNAGVMVGSFFNDQDRPLQVPSGEFWLQHKSGSFLKFLNNGDVSVHTARDLLVDSARDVQVTAARDVTASVGRNFSATITGYAHVTSAAEITLAAPVVSINAPIIGLNGNVTQTTGSGLAGVTMQGPVHVVDSIRSDTEVIAQTTPLHTHAHINVEPGSGTSGPPTP